jgi:hypothetical protein
VNYNLTVVFTNIVGASASLWNLGTVLTPTGPRQISAGNPLPIGARITVPAGATSVDVALRAESTDLQFVRTSDAIALTVGSTPTVSDPRVLVTLAAIPPFDPATGLPNSVREAVIDSVNGVEVRFGASGQIPINVHVTGTAAAAGTYTYTATVESAGTLWTPGTVVPATSGQAAPSDRVLSVGIHNTDTSHSTAVRFMRVTATHQTSAGVQDFASFIRFPIRGIV